MPSLKNATEYRSLVETGEITRCIVDEYLLLVHRSKASLVLATMWISKLTHHIPDVDDEGIFDGLDRMPCLGRLVENLKTPLCACCQSLFALREKASEQRTLILHQ